ncbi:MAG: GAF domain-containing protein, partial [Dehalococcoidia bacterium]
MSLTNKSRQLMEMTLDTLSRQLKTDCCWVQLVNFGTEKLPLIASLGFTPEMYQEMDLLDKEHVFSHEVVGLGHNIVISSLQRDGQYNIPVFRKSGFKSLLAVPIMTYRVHGILGIGYRSRMKFNDEFTHLVNVIANLLGMSLHKSNLNRQWLQKDQQDNTRPVTAEPDDQVAEAGILSDKSRRESENKPVKTDKKKAPRKSFNEHDRN